MTKFIYDTLGVVQFLKFCHVATKLKNILLSYEKKVT